MSNIKAINQSVYTLIEEISLNKDILLNLTDIRTTDNALYVHSVNVCIMSILTGTKMGLDRVKLQELAIGALLHDIGKVIPESKRLDEHHSWIGFNFLRKNKEISTLSSHIALAHHEHIDGSGVPRGMAGKDIHLLAKITAAANFYDNLVAGGSGNMEPLRTAVRTHQSSFFF
ncbi:HD-GYP domain-containing protein [Alteribacillus sp. JSM 102045]|uniref:HD-GYP domain-containing protein n=1 Tax=Alteribacillus sp. JSM 102045 TaxID=1562101 RepID=UPI0035C070FB